MWSPRCVITYMYMYYSRKKCTNWTKKVPGQHFENLQHRKRVALSTKCFECFGVSTETIPTKLGKLVALSQSDNATYFGAIGLASDVCFACPVPNLRLHTG